MNEIVRELRDKDIDDETWRRARDHFGNFIYSSNLDWM